ncbi:hypothetical protein D3C76_1848750 [compost metagenome]
MVVKISRSSTSTVAGIPVPIITQTKLKENNTATREKENSSKAMVKKGASTKIRLNISSATAAA